MKDKKLVKPGKIDKLDKLDKYLDTQIHNNYQITRCPCENNGYIPMDIKQIEKSNNLLNKLAIKAKKITQNKKKQNTISDISDTISKSEKDIKNKHNSTNNKPKPKSTYNLKSIIVLIVFIFLVITIKNETIKDKIKLLVSKNPLMIKYLKFIKFLH